ncbi:hypothetical protein SAMN05216456_3305 [Devosia crocina]|uniref:Uncharacterized protein n=1 Tax=Devosia crocina TaxID=429728 RepID=A0A1I7NUN3_9HYPH|nr:hypothetical protein SAMN05216456_3305 [Devosia crocina]
MTLIVAFVLAVFATFAVALGYAQIQTRGLVAPGARPLD